MKKTVFFVALMIGVLLAQGQTAKLSPTAALKAMEIRQGKCVEDEVHAFAILAEGVDIKALGAYGVKVNTMAGDIATMWIPTKQMADFAASGLCTYIDVARQMYPLLDKVRADMGIDNIYNGLNLPQGYDGTGVVVGVIDIGLEYGHPSFYDSTGTTLRIKRVWQQLDSTGTAPAGFTYGSELTTPEQMLAAVTDRVEQGHGSHVTGIAAGCGAPSASGKRYRGIAPGADIVLVATNMDEASIVDGIHYIHEYARSVHKPCVINMSIGSMAGPHDGRGMSDVAVENLTEGVDSLVLVVAAANSGGNKNHLHYEFSATDTVMHSYGNMDRANKLSCFADCWGRVNDQFSVSLALHDNLAGNYTLVDETPFISSEVDSAYSFQLRSPRDTVYQCTIMVNTNNPLNNRPEIILVIEKNGAYNPVDVFSLTIKSDSADIHVWSGAMNFSSNANPQYVEGDNQYTIGGVAANTDAVISVGSYATRTSRISNGSVSGLVFLDEGDFSSFSSRGPTWDGRVKPDICTPGQLISSVFSTPYMPYYGTTMLFDSTFWGGRNYYYCLMQGTSMASPVMTGIVALWLQNNPSLNVDTVRTLLHTTARKDSYTGDIPATGNNNWGWGKANAFAGLPPTTVPMHYVKVAADNYQHGEVGGNGLVAEGQHVIEATPCVGFAFSEWNDGVTDNPRVVNITSDTMFVANFTQAPCDTIRQFPWNIVVSESLLNCWDNFSLADSLFWLPFPPLMISAAMPGRDVVDTWLVSPYLVPDENCSLIYSCRSLNSDSLAVEVITDNGDTVRISDEHITPQTDELQVSLSPYVGQLIRFAFHHHATVMSSAIMLSAMRVDYVQGIGDVEFSNISVATSGLRMTVAGAPEKQLNVYDVMGRCVLSSPKANGTFQLPVSGVYILRIGNLPPRKIVLVR